MRTAAGTQASASRRAGGSPSNRWSRWVRPRPRQRRAAHVRGSAREATAAAAANQARAAPDAALVLAHGQSRVLRARRPNPAATSRPFHLRDLRPIPAAHVGPVARIRAACTPRCSQCQGRSAQRRLPNPGASPWRLLERVDFAGPDPPMAACSPPRRRRSPHTDSAGSALPVTAVALRGERPRRPNVSTADVPPGAMRRISGRRP